MFGFTIRAGDSHEVCGVVNTQTTMQYFCSILAMHLENGRVSGHQVHLRVSKGNMSTPDRLETSEMVSDGFTTAYIDVTPRNLAVL